MSQETLAGRNIPPSDDPVWKKVAGQIENADAGNPAARSIEAVRLASHGVLDGLFAEGVAEAETLDHSLVALTAEDGMADLFTVAAGFDKTAAETADSDYQRQQRKLAGLSRACAATAAATAVRAMNGAELAGPVTSIAHSMVEEGHFAGDISPDAYRVLSRMVGEIGQPPQPEQPPESQPQQP
jgi:hypothetical protein